MESLSNNLLTKSLPFTDSSFLTKEKKEKKGEDKIEQNRIVKEKGRKGKEKINRK